MGVWGHVRFEYDLLGQIFDFFRVDERFHQQDRHFLLARGTGPISLPDFGHGGYLSDFGLGDCAPDV